MKIFHRFRALRWKRFFIWLTFLFLLTSSFVTVCHIGIENRYEEFVYSDLNQVPYNRVGLVLGTSKRLKNGTSNPYFDNRIKAAAELYYAGKIEKIVLSGDNGSRYYNEPMDMKKALLRLGVKDEDIYLDFAGFRTLDSVIRCNKIFGQNTFTVISQEFHNKRALFIARNAGLKTIAYNALDLENPQMEMREYLARTKAVLDIFLLEQQPRFLGERITIN